MRITRRLLIPMLAATAFRAEACDDQSVPAFTGLTAPTIGHLLSPFGLRRNPLTGRFGLHTGIDIGGRIGDPVHAAAGGRVLFAGEDGSYGRLIVIQHAGAALDTLYAHLASTSVIAGDCVRGGQRIGTIGQSGEGSGPHLHFEVRKAVDPAPFVAKGRR